MEDFQSKHLGAEALGGQKMPLFHNGSIYPPTFPSSFSLSPEPWVEKLNYRDGVVMVYNLNLTSSAHSLRSLSLPPTFWVLRKLQASVGGHRWPACGPNSSL